MPLVSHLTRTHIPIHIHIHIHTHIHIHIHWSSPVRRDHLRMYQTQLVVHNELIETNQVRSRVLQARANVPEKARAHDGVRELYGGLLPKGPG